MARAGRLCDARGARRRDGDRAVRQEGRGAGRAPRRADHPYQRLLRAQPFRRDRGRRRRCAARRRNAARAGDDDRPARAQSRWRAGGVSDQGIGWLEMKAKIRKLVTVVEETRVEMDRAVEPPTRRAAAVAVIENPFAGPLCRGSLAADRHWRGTRRALGGARRRRARHRGSERGELRQSGGCRRERRTRARRRGAAPEARRASAQGPGQGRRAHSLLQEARRARRRARRAARPQGRRVRAQPFRWNGGAHRRRAAGERDHGGGRRNRFRPPASARWRIDKGRDQRGRRTALGLGERLRNENHEPQIRDIEHENLLDDLIQRVPRRRIRRRRPSRRGRHDQDRRNQLLFRDSLLHRALSQGLAARPRRDQRGGRRRRQETRGDQQGRWRQAGGRGDRRQRARGERRRCDACGNLLLQHRPRCVRLRQTEEDILPRSRAADRRDHALQGQSLHVPSAAGHLRAGRDARGRGGEVAGEEMGDYRAELRIRPVRGRRFQEVALRQAPGHPVGWRAMAAAGQDRRGRGRRGDRQDRAGRDLQRHFRGRPRQARARGRYRAASSRIARS